MSIGPVEILVISFPGNEFNRTEGGRQGLAGP